MTNPFDQVLSDLYLIEEGEILSTLQTQIGLSAQQRKSAENRAVGIVEILRHSDQKIPLIDRFLLEYGLSTTEGVVLMRLAEALLRTPDKATRNQLMRDRLIAGDWRDHAGKASSALVNMSTTGLRIAKKWIEKSGGVEGRSLVARLGDKVLGLAVNQAMVIMGEHFVLGKTIDAAIKTSRKLHKSKSGKIGFYFSYDMLGEAAITQEDADRYFAAYLRAVNALVASGETFGDLSVKLSAIHPRYELAQHASCVPALTARVKELALVCKQGGFGLAIDAEEAERLEVSLMVVKNLLADPELIGWNGLSIVVQAYQRRASATLKWLVHEAKKQSRKIAIRLVKGAYWDSEIKRAQEMGLSDYPVFTRKENTDVSYIACAKYLFDNLDVVFPQFATHNAHTAAVVLELAPDNAAYEFQCLHGMGEALHRCLVEKHGASSRIYAPVGQHADLLPYLVRRLLENGANSSFVNQLVDPDVEISDIVRDPQDRIGENIQAQNPALPMPRDYLNQERLAAKGLDLTQIHMLADVQTWFDAPPFYIAGKGVKKHAHEIYNPANQQECVGHVFQNTSAQISKAVTKAHASNWSQTPHNKRASILRDAAIRLENQTPILLPLLVREAGKSLNDAVAEIAEAVDFCRYYADRCEDDAFKERKPLGVMACISPWNFPLAIFIGQVAAALAAGNSVIAKPAEQTPLIASICVDILREAGVPADALHLVCGGGEIGAGLVAEEKVSGVCFTGSTATAKKIAKTLVDTGRATAPLIAETGGINAMIIDSTALLEQAVNDVVASAFQSAGQRCSACRIVCVQDDIADAFTEMLSGAMALLNIGDPSDPATDVGPVIDTGAAQTLREYIGGMETAKTIYKTNLPHNLQSDLFVTPIAFEVKKIADVTHEIFGPVLHVVRFKASEFGAVVSDINALGYGLTMGLHTRIDSRVENVIAKACVGNLYINRNQIGAVVGVQPFGGEGLSGTGPKAGGPHYLYQMTLLETQNPEPVSNLKAEHIKLSLEEKNIMLKTLARSRHAFNTWQNYDRATVLNTAAQYLGTTRLSMASLCKDAAKLSTKIFDVENILPGPTGEKNTLRYAPRGVLIANGGVDMHRAMFTALSAGNSVLVETGIDNIGDIMKLVEALDQAGAPKNTIMPISKNEAWTFIDSDIDGVISDRENLHILNARVKCREGKILPVLSAQDMPERFALERTVTIDTTAAGGNASLLASL